MAGLISPWAEAVFNHAAGGLALGLVWVARAAAALPGGALTIPPPSAWLVAGWYAALLVLTWGLWRYTREPDSGAAWLTELGGEKDKRKFSNRVAENPEQMRTRSGGICREGSS